MVEAVVRAVTALFWWRVFIAAALTGREDDIWCCRRRADAQAHTSLYDGPKLYFYIHTSCTHLCLGDA